MDATAGNAYLETQIATATPQRLRLMLIDGAIRYGHLTIQAWEENRPADALESLIRCRSIVSELIAGVRPGSSSLADRVVSLYLFLFQELTFAQLHQDRLKVGDVLRILDEERETWRQICRQMPEAPLPGVDSQPQEFFAPAFIAESCSSANGSERLSLEA